ncbi:unnamed protein product [Ceratitis capitata]|uniref:(Mediterranean fruit fly) hypothetical protein n=1 Tax=Ceratitis capitata TaxID=7213 RepID=A0A811UYQ5_CERCA|nr:unnamed protein product [Ceratitis capitata]
MYSPPSYEETYYQKKSTNNNNYNDKNTAHKQPKANDVVAADYDDNGDNSTATLYLTLSRRCS